jgi:hypothetical protein
VGGQIRDEGLFIEDSIQETQILDEEVRYLLTVINPLEPP